jgi:hypothetical protein
MKDLGNVRTVRIWNYLSSPKRDWMNDDRLQGEQNLKMTIQQYIEGFNRPVCLRGYQALEFKLESA